MTRGENWFKGARNRYPMLKWTVLRSMPIMLALILVAGCGGSSGTPSVPSNPHNVPANPFADAIPVFSGTATQAVLTQGNALYFGASAQRAIDLIATVSSGMQHELIPPADTPPALFWNSYGSQTWEGRLNSDGTSWYETTIPSTENLPINSTYSLTNYGLTPDLNPIHSQLQVVGEAQIRYLTPVSSNPVHFIISFYGFEVTANGIDLVLNGTVEDTLTNLGQFPPFVTYGTYLANLSIQDKIANTQTLLKNFAVTSTFINGADETDLGVSVSGTFVDANYGAVQVSPGNVPLHYNFAVTTLGPFNGGYFKIQGSNPAVVYFGGLNYYFASVGFDPTGLGIPSEAQRYSWSSGQVDDTPANWTTGPVAVASIMLPTETGTYGVLDGRLSYSPAGKFITFAWSIEMAPPGSRPHFDDSTSATPQLILDQLGQYLVKLTVSDGIHSAVDREVVVANDALNRMQGGDSKVGPLNILGNVGQAITLDYRLHTNAQTEVDSLGLPTCTLSAPTGSAATLAASGTQMPTFTPDVAGYYLLSCSSLTTVVNVNEPYQFSPPVLVLPFMQDGAQFVPTDLNSDGKQDFVYTWSYPTNYVMVAINQGNGMFTTQTFPVGLGTFAAVGDLNGDGLPDVAVDSGDKFDILLQGAGGNFTLGTPVSITCTSPDIPLQTSQITIGKVASDSVASVFYAGSCYDGLRVYRNDGSGHFTAGSAYSNVHAVQVADVTGDGINDLLYLNITGPVTAEKLVVTVQPGMSDGTFGAAAQYDTSTTGAGSGGFTKMQLTDFNNDGLTDVTVLADSVNMVQLAILEQKAGALTSAINYDFSALTPSTANIGDINGDGLDDFVYLDNHGGLTIALGQTDHSLGVPSEYPIANYRNEINVQSNYGPSLRILDFNADGIPDVMFSNGVVMLGERPGQ